MASSSRLFKPVALGQASIHRVAMAPLTRFRAEDGTQAPKNIVPEYYEQRASPGTLLITEATFIALEAAGYPKAPGIWSQSQISQWKEVTSRVHAKQGVIYLQLWALGRANQGGQEGVRTVAPSPIPIEGAKITPEEMTEEDILRYVELYRQAALNAIEAGFDGVEIHSANGYLLDQALQSVSNKRTDKWGGASVENRTRFPLAVVEAVASAVGQERTAIRLSPWSTFQSMQEKNPLETFGHFSRELIKGFPKLSYVHFVEPVAWADGAFHASNIEEGVHPSNDCFRALFRGIDPASIDLKSDATVFPDPEEAHPTVFLAAGGFKRETAPAHAERTGDVVVFGRSFIANPDLPYRIRKDIDFQAYDRSTFYADSAEGYTTYPFANDESKSEGVKVGA